MRKVKGLSDEQLRKRNRKLIAYADQKKPRDRLIAEGFGVPQDTWPPLTVYDNSGSSRPRELRSESGLTHQIQHSLTTSQYTD